jgi:hypothetical protein
VDVSKSYLSYRPRKLAYFWDLGHVKASSMLDLSAQAGLLKPDDDERVEVPEFHVSYKPQKISPKFQNSVRMLLHKKIRESYMHPQFNTDVMKPLRVSRPRPLLPVSPQV